MFDEAAWVINLNQAGSQSYCGQYPNSGLEFGYLSGYSPYTPAGFYSNLFPYYTTGDGCGGQTISNSVLPGGASFSASGTASSVGGASWSWSGGSASVPLNYSVTYPRTNLGQGEVHEVSPSDGVTLGGNYGNGETFTARFQPSGSNSYYLWGQMTTSNQGGSPYFVNKINNYTYKNGGS